MDRRRKRTEENKRTGSREQGITKGKEDIEKTKKENDGETTRTGVVHTCNGTQKPLSDTGVPFPSHIRPDSDHVVGPDVGPLHLCRASTPRRGRVDVWAEY